MTYKPSENYGIHRQHADGGARRHQRLHRLVLASIVRFTSVFAAILDDQKEAGSRSRPARIVSDETCSIGLKPTCSYTRFLSPDGVGELGRFHAGRFAARIALADQLNSARRVTRGTMPFG